VANAVNGDYAGIDVDQDTKTGRRMVDSLNAGVFPITADEIEEIIFFLKFV
jgi:hypothetical protein